MRDISNFSKKFKKPRLYKDDLQKVENIISEAGGRGFAIKVNNFEFDSVAEINITKKSNAVSLTSSSPYISLDISRHSCTLFSTGRDLAAKGALLEITNVVLKRERKFVFLFENFLLLVVATSAAWLWIVSDRISLTLFLSTWLIVASTYAYIYFFVSPVVEFRNSDERKNFFSRNKDGIALALISGVVGWILAHL